MIACRTCKAAPLVQEMSESSWITNRIYHRQYYIRCRVCRPPHARPWRDTREEAEADWDAANTIEQEKQEAAPAKTTQPIEFTRAAGSHGNEALRGALAELAYEAVARQMRALARHRERYIRAWIAATGLHPTECQFEEQRLGDGRVVIRVTERPGARLVPPAHSAQAEHSPAPWGWTVPVGDRYAVENTVLRAADGQAIAIEALGHQLSEKKKTTRALIAAAPELLAALEALLNHAGGADCCCGPDEDWCPAKKARALIARVKEGR